MCAGCQHVLTWPCCSFTFTINNFDQICYWIVEFNNYYLCTELIKVGYIGGNWSVCRTCSHCQGGLSGHACPDILRMTYTDCIWPKITLLLHRVFKVKMIPQHVWNCWGEWHIYYMKSSFKAVGQQTVAEVHHKCCLFVPSVGMLQTILIQEKDNWLPTYLYTVGKKQEDNVLTGQSIPGNFCLSPLSKILIVLITFHYCYLSYIYTVELPSCTLCQILCQLAPLPTVHEILT